MDKMVTTNNKLLVKTIIKIPIENIILATIHIATHPENITVGLLHTGHIPASHAMLYWQDLVVIKAVVVMLVVVVHLVTQKIGMLQDHPQCHQSANLFQQMVLEEWMGHYKMCNQGNQSK